MFDDLSLSNLLSGHISPRTISNIEFLILLLLMMLVMNALKISGLLSSIGQRLVSYTKNEKYLALSLCMFVFIASTFLTNDVVLLGVVPLTIVIGVVSRVNAVKIVIFEGIAANAGSLLTPFGNPQNIYISVYYHVTLIEFMKTMMPLWIISMILLIVIVLVTFTDKQLHKVHVKQIHYGIASLGIVALFLVILYFGHILPLLVITPAVVILLGATSKIKRIVHMFDWKLFLIFVGIAIITTIILGLVTFNAGGLYVLFSAVGLSQVISNVPATFVLSGMADWKLLALGVNIGGSGTLISSIATVIAYRYAKHYDSKTRMTDFMKWGALFCIMQLIFIVALILFVGI